MTRTEERRRTLRQRVFLSGRVVYGEGAYSRGCSITERSDQGARIRLVNDEPLPSSFQLIDVAKGLVHEAKIVWIKFPHAGVTCPSSEHLAQQLG